MPVVDLMPELYKRNGSTLQKSGARLTADLVVVREQINQLVSVLENGVGELDSISLAKLRESLYCMLKEIDGIDPQNPPVPEALEFLSSRLMLTISAIKLLLQKEVIMELGEHLNPECKNRHVERSSSGSSN